MKTLSWNCRGLGSLRNLRFLKEIVLQKRPNFLFLCEILCNKQRMERVRIALGFEGMVVVEAQGHSGGLALLWKNNEDAQLLSYSKNHIDITISSKDHPSHRITGIYG